MKKTAMALLLAALWAPDAHALCVATAISGLPSTTTFAAPGGEYFVYDTTERLQTVAFDVTTQTSIGGCRYYVTLSAGSSGSTAARRMTRGATTLNYNAYATSSKDILNVTGAYNGANVISGSFAFLGGMQTNHHNLYWTIDPLQVVAYSATRFQDATLDIKVWAELALGIYTNTDTKTITFQARAESSVDLSLVNTGGAFVDSDNTQTVNFGNMSTGQSMSFDTLIRSNQGYVVKFQSQNSQRLRHQNYPTVATTVPYTTTFGGNNVNLTGGTAVTVATSAVNATTPAAGTRFATVFTIGTITGTETMGDYQDIITVTVSAN